MQQINHSVIELGNAAILNNRKSDTVVFESGCMYRIYGRKNENKLKLIGQCSPPDFEQWDEYHFQRQYQYLGQAKVVKIKRTLKLELN